MAIVGLLSDEQTVARAVTLFSALGDRSRLIIIRELARGGSIRVGELVTRLGLAQGTVSGHLAVLRYSGLVTVEVQRNHRLYSLAHSQTLDLLSLAEQLLSGPPNS